MTPEDSARILEPIWQGFAAARCRLVEVRESMDLGAGHVALARHVGETQDAEAYLAQVLNRFLDPASGGLLTVIQAGRRVHAWPNAQPHEEARQVAEIRYFARRFEAEILNPVQPLKIGQTA